jgi:hypothetical protein
MTLDHLKLYSNTPAVGDHHINSPKSSVDHLTPQFKQYQHCEVPRSTHGNSSSRSVQEREYITIVLRSHYKFRTLKFTSLGSLT